MSAAAVQEAVERTEIRLVDCDIHPTFRLGFRELAPYFSEGWREHLGLAGQVAIDQFGGVREAAIELPRSPFYFPIHGGFRVDAVPPGGGVPASDPHFVAEQHLDPYNVDRGLLLGQHALTLGAFVHPGFATAYASAYNDWLEQTWLRADPRFRGAIVVAVQDPAAAAAEVRRVAARNDAWVAVLVPPNNVLMGELSYYPIYEAASEFGIPVVVHITGVEGTFVSAPALAGGTPATYFETKTTYTSVYQSHLVSLVGRGVFERFPTLQVGFIECGIGWLPEIMWRMDTNWKALRDEVPWVTRLPSDYVLDHVRFTSQPFVEPPNASQLRNFCEMISVDRTLMFASDYPHYDFDDPARTLALIPREARRKVEVENALDFFGDRLLVANPSASADAVLGSA